MRIILSHITDWDDFGVPEVFIALGEDAATDCEKCVRHLNLLFDLLYAFMS